MTIDLCVMSEVQKAYVAGLMDSDGCITVAKQSPSKTSRAKTDLHYALATVTNTNEAMMRWLKDNVGGAYSNRTTGRFKQLHIDNNWKDRYEWRVTGKKAEKFLEDIQPYLVIKRKQCELAMSIGKLREQLNVRMGETLSQEVVEKREQVKQEIHRLNKKGRPQ